MAWVRLCVRMATPSSFVSVRFDTRPAGQVSKSLRSDARSRDGERVPLSDTLKASSRLASTHMSRQTGGVPPTSLKVAAAPSQDFGVSTLLVPSK